MLFMTHLLSHRSTITLQDKQSSLLLTRVSPARPIMAGCRITIDAVMTAKLECRVHARLRG